MKKGLILMFLISTFLFGFSKDELMNSDFYDWKGYTYSEQVDFIKELGEAGYIKEVKDISRIILNLNEYSEAVKIEPDEKTYILSRKIKVIAKLLEIYLD